MLAMLSDRRLLRYSGGTRQVSSFLRDIVHRSISTLHAVALFSPYVSVCDCGKMWF